MAGPPAPQFRYRRRRHQTVIRSPTVILTATSSTGIRSWSTASLATPTTTSVMCSRTILVWPRRGSGSAARRPRVRLVVRTRTTGSGSIMWLTRWVTNSLPATRSTARTAAVEAMRRAPSRPALSRGAVRRFRATRESVVTTTCSGRTMVRWVTTRTHQTRTSTQSVLIRSWLTTPRSLLAWRQRVTMYRRPMLARKSSFRHKRHSS